MKQKRQTWVTRNSPGFTLIEVMVGIIIMAATAATMFYGVAYARSQARKIIIQQRALEELRSQMDYWMVRILDGNLTNHELLGDTRGTEVTLYNPDADEQDDEEAFKALIYREPMERGYSDHDPQEDSPYYWLEMYIKWSDHLGDPTGEPMELRMQYSVFKNL
jgi:prepilin-type N-terminal cleavage/methylation domain-containing protein